MNQSLKEFGRRLDDVQAGDIGIVNEGAHSIVVSDLASSDATSLVELAQTAGLKWTAEDASNDLIADVTSFDTDLAPYRLTIEKPVVGGSFVLFTLHALRQALNNDDPGKSWKHVQSDQPFTTMARRFERWDDKPFELVALFPRTDPRELVRESGDPTVPARVDPWLLDMPLAFLPENDPVFDEWARVAHQMACRCLAGEILVDGTMVYPGPPKLKIAEQDLALSQDHIAAMQRALKWVYETDHQAEIRHGLMGAELARHGIDRGLTAAVLSAALEGAKIAYQLSLSGISKDALKAIADVRKAVTEEINKTADTARQLATAVAGAVFLGLGVVAARVTSTAPPALLIALSLVLAVYVCSMIFASSHFMRLQESLRSDWKQRFYGFLGTDDYEKLVTDPLRKAKNGFLTVSWIAGLISMGMVVAVIVFVSIDFGVAQGIGTGAGAPTLSGWRAPASSPTP